MSQEVINTQSLYTMVAMAYFGDGTAASPSLTFNDDIGHNTGVYRYAEDIVGVTTGGIDKLIIGTDITSSANIIPSDDSTYDLGSALKYWLNAYVDALYSSALINSATALIIGNASYTTDISGSIIDYNADTHDWYKSDGTTNLAVLDVDKMLIYGDTSIMGINAITDITTLQGAQLQIYRAATDDCSARTVYVKNKSTIAYGAEYQVDTAILNTQNFSTIAGLVAGGYVIAWQSNQTGDYRIYAQNYNALGVVVGGEYQVNTSAVSTQGVPDITGLVAGGYVICWHSNHTGDYRIYAQNYDASGVVVGIEYQVNTTTANDQQNPSISSLPAGGYVIAWHSDQTGDHRIFAQNYDASGVVVGIEYQVNTTTTNEQYDSSISSLTAGGYVIAWWSDQTGDYDVFAQNYDASGVVVGSEYKVNTTTATTQAYPSIAGLVAGGYVISWQSNHVGQFRVYAQNYDASGVAVGVEYEVSTSGGDQGVPNVIGLVDGGYVITWYGNPSGSNEIYARNYDANGATLISKYQVNTNMTNNQITSNITSLRAGGYVICWEGNQTGDYRVYAQNYSNGMTGFSDIYIDDTPTFNNTSFTGYDTDTYYLLRHYLSTIGDPVYKVAVTSSNITVYGDILPDSAGKDIGSATVPFAEGYFGVASNYVQLDQTNAITFNGTTQPYKIVDLEIQMFNDGLVPPTAGVYSDTWAYLQYTIGDISVTQVVIPQDVDVSGTIDIYARWYIDEDYATGSGEIQWQVIIRAVADNELITAGFTDTYVSGDIDIPATATTIEESKIDTIPVSSIAQYDSVSMSISRIAIVAGNNPVAEPRLLGLSLKYRVGQIGQTT